MANPVRLSLREWADSIVLISGDNWAFGRLERGDRWQEWAVGFVRAQPFAQRCLPDPYDFADWREWAMRAYPMIESQD